MEALRWGRGRDWVYFGIPCTDSGEMEKRL
jgi:hypothetical protein